jgi:menaquinone-dependent protoporphyrinogen oxidase
MAIGKELQSAGYAVDVVEIKAVVSPGDYHAVVIGGPRYMGKVVSEVGKFVSRHAKELGRLPIAVFTVGTSIVNGNPEAAQNAEKCLRTAVAPLIPVAEIAFSGKLDPTNLSFFQRKITEMVKPPVGDFRDWVAIAKWARELPQVLMP